MNKNLIYSPMFLVNKNLCTTFENKFFNLIDHFDITIYLDSKEFSVDKMEIFRLSSAFNEEILENIILFNNNQKNNYLNRIMERVNQSNRNCFFESAGNPGLKVFLKGEEFIPVSDFNAYFRIMERKKSKLISFIQSLMDFETDERQNLSYTPDLKPVINLGILPGFIEILQQYFSLEQRIMLNELLSTGNDAPEPLIFLGNGNRLADMFKQLYNAGMILVCSKKELESWIIRNFRFIVNKQTGDFSPYYLNRIISAKNDSCRNPIINLYKDHITGKFFIKEL